MRHVLYERDIQYAGSQREVYDLEKDEFEIYTTAPPGVCCDTERETDLSDLTE